jgi:hypothetical protein
MADMDINRINADLLAGGLHSGQTNPVHIPELGDTLPAQPWINPDPPHIARYTASDLASQDYKKWLALQEEGCWLRQRLRLGWVPNFWRQLE